MISHFHFPLWFTEPTHCPKHRTRETVSPSYITSTSWPVPARPPLSHWGYLQAPLSPVLARAGSFLSPSPAQCVLKEVAYVDHSHANKPVCQLQHLPTPWEMPTWRNSRWHCQWFSLVRMLMSVPEVCSGNLQRASSPGVCAEQGRTAASHPRAVFCHLMQLLTKLSQGQLHQLLAPFLCLWGPTQKII